MRLRTIIVFCLALVFGAVAVFTTRAWLQGQRSALTAGGNFGSPVVENSIVVASRSLRFGDRIEEDVIREIPWPSATLPNGSFKSKQELLKPGARFVTSAIELDEPVLAWKVTGPGQRATLSAALTEGLKAITIRVNDVLGVAGFVLPGDRVDVLLTRGQFVDVLLQGLKVLAIDQVADDRRDQPAVVKAVTFEVSTREAQILTLAAQVGQLSLALRNIASSEVEKTKRVTMADLEGKSAAATELVQKGERDEGDALIPPLPAPKIATVSTPPDNKVPVGVVRNFKRTVYKVSPPS